MDEAAVDAVLSLNIISAKYLKSSHNSSRWAARLSGQAQGHTAILLPSFWRAGLLLDPPLLGQSKCLYLDMAPGESAFAEQGHSVGGLSSTQR